MSSTLPIPKTDTAPTMGELIQRILGDPGLAEARRRNVASSIRRFCAALDVSVDQAPAAFWFFRERLEGFHPAKAGIKAHRWQTIRSDVAFALKRIGLSPDQPKPRPLLSPAWQELRARMRAAGIQWGLSRLARFCNARDIPPSAVDDGVMAAYDAFIRPQTFKTKPQRHHRDVCRLWNRVAELAPELQLRPVTLPSYRENYSPPWQTLPQSFRAEAEAWLTGMSEEGDFPPWQTVSYYFRRWQREGVWARVHHKLVMADRERAGRDASPSAAILDSQTVRTADQKRGFKGFDAGKKVHGRKRHILTDTDGRRNDDFRSDAAGNAGPPRHDPMAQDRLRVSPRTRCGVLSVLRE